MTITKESAFVIVDLFFENPDFQVSLVRYLAGTYDEFRRESTL